jgi:flavin-dependent dehydrogenase
MNVALIEKKTFPRIKPCGGGLSEKACQLIGGIVDLKKIRGRRILGSYLCFKNKHLCHVSQNIESYSIQRDDFDNALLDAAKNQGCDIYMPTEVIHVQEKASKVTVTIEDGNQIESEFLVLAEGIAGGLYKQIGYSGKREWTMALEVDVFPKTFPNMFLHNTLFDFGVIDKGYGWIFPKDDRINMGTYYYYSPRIDRSQIRALELFVKEFQWANDGKIGKIKGYPLPYKIDYPAFNTGRTLLVGDAAGSAENLYGQGLYYGFLSSKLAAETLIEFFNNGSLDSYTKKLKSKVLSQIKFSRLTARHFYNHQRFGYYNMARNKLMNIFYSKLIHGKITQKKALFYTIMALPFSFFFPNFDDCYFSEINQNENGTVEALKSSRPDLDIGRNA